MLRYEKNTDDRKVLVRRLEELTGERSVYSMMPRCVYEIGPYTVGKDGSLTVEEGEADLDILNTLLYEELVIGVLPEEPVETTADEQQEVPEAETEAPESEAEAPEPVWETEDYLDISFPASKHTGVSLRNLVNLVYSRGAMINKAAGTHFGVEKELVEELSDDRCVQTQESFRRALADYGAADGNGMGMSGITITPEMVTFHGFPQTQNPERTKAFTELVELMNRMAIGQKRIQAKETAVENEKYAFRIWLVRLGMKGEAYKKSRKILLENLDGNCAFRTAEEAERFKVREKQKRDARKAAGISDSRSISEDTAEAVQEGVE